MFDFLSNAAKLVANVVTLPISVAADIVTLGGELNDRHESYTESKLSRVSEQADKALDDIAG